MSKLLFVFILFMFTGSEILGQQSNTIRGKIVDEATSSPVEYATITLFNTDKDIIGGGISEADGTFLINYTASQPSVVIEYLAYKTLTLTIPQGSGNDYDFGIIKLTSSAIAMEEVQIVAQKSTTQYHLDRRTFNVGSDISSRGRNALDVLSNVPSVSVDVDGAITLRGNTNVRVFINGRPSSLSGTNVLRTLTATQIEKIEVVTNPSARFEAEGMAGIINIILKKNSQKGFSGNVDLTAGWPNELGIGTGINYRSGPLNFFVNYGLQNRKSIGSGFNYLETYLQDSINTIYSKRKSEAINKSHDVKSGLEWFFNEKESVTATFGFNKGDNKNISDLIYKFANYDGIANRNYTENLKDYVVRDELENEDGSRKELSIDYKKEFRKDKNLSAFFQYFSTDEVEVSVFNENQYLNEVKKGLILSQQSRNAENENNIQAQFDYSVNNKKLGKIELGAKYSDRKIKNDYYVEELVENQWSKLEGLSNKLIYDEAIAAAYFTQGQQFKKFSYQAGLRAEYSDINTQLLETREVNPRNYIGLFPNVFLNYQKSEKNQYQLSISRRINRPRFWDLNPFFSFTDRINFFGGNPNLNPEYTWSFEVSQIRYYKVFTFTSSVYARNSTDIIQRVKTINDDGTTLTRPLNLAKRQDTGLEILAAFNEWKLLKFDGELNLFHSNIYGNEVDPSLNTSAFNIQGRVNLKLNTLNNTDFQIRTNFRGPQNVPQGQRKSQLVFDLSIGKDITKSLSLTFNARDFFNQRKWVFERETDDFYEDGENQRSRNSYTLTLSYRLNKEKSKKPSKTPQGENNDNGIF